MSEHVEYVRRGAVQNLLNERQALKERAEAAERERDALLRELAGIERTALLYGTVDQWRAFADGPDGVVSEIIRIVARAQAAAPTPAPAPGAVERVQELEQFMELVIICAIAEGWRDETDGRKVVVDKILEMSNTAALRAGSADGEGGADGN